MGPPRAEGEVWCVVCWDGEEPRVVGWVHVWGVLGALGYGGFTLKGAEGVVLRKAGGWGTHKKWRSS
jgi:hypothetical protein